MRKNSPTLNRPWLLCLLGFCLLGCPACVSVQAYEKMYLNDEEMALQARGIEYFETNIETYREGAAGATGGKSGGGCGCN